MDYTVKQLARLSGVTTRTLRYYDEIGLLKPERTAENGYRIYGQAQVDLLQQILFYRELGMSLGDIREILDSGDFDRERALESHLEALLQKKEQVEMLIENVSKTLSAMKGEVQMNDEEKFRGFQKERIAENEKAYGAEIREKYGAQAIDAANERMTGMTKEQWEKQERLAKEILETLEKAMETKNPAGELAQKAYGLHKEWLCMFWPDGMYSKEAHRGMGEMYVADERFRAYYESAGEGAADFLKEALEVYCG
ncbi:MAG: MerR family transcriptional regulator [Eubacteriales bacterium]|nr:MerR family transcriptional regulator [Eubacteriales bacterium]